MSYAVAAASASSYVPKLCTDMRCSGYCDVAGGTKGAGWRCDPLQSNSLRSAPCSSRALVKVGSPYLSFQQTGQHQTVQHLFVMRTESLVGESTAARRESTKARLGLAAPASHRTISLARIIRKRAGHAPPRSISFALSFSIT
jgi:hypothetical protein